MAFIKSLKLVVNSSGSYRIDFSRSQCTLQYSDIINLTVECVTAKRMGIFHTCQIKERNTLYETKLRDSLFSRQYVDIKPD